MQVRLLPIAMSVDGSEDKTVTSSEAIDKIEALAFVLNSTRRDPTWRLMMDSPRLRESFRELKSYHIATTNWPSRYLGENR